MEGYTFITASAGNTPVDMYHPLKCECYKCNYLATCGSGVVSQDIKTLKEEIAALKKDNALLRTMIDTLAAEAGIQFQEGQPVFAVLPPYRGFK